MKYIQKIREIIFPLDQKMEQQYRYQQLVTVSTPLRIAAMIASLILWIVVYRVHLTIPDKPIYWSHAMIVQAWLLFMMIATTKTGPIRHLAVWTTPFFPAIIALFFTQKIIPFLPSAALMEQAYGLNCLLILIFYGLETIYPLLALIAGISTSSVLIYARVTNPSLVATQAHVLQLHVLISNLIGLIMCINLCYVSRIQFKNARKAEQEREVSDSLIRRVFPESIGQELRSKGTNLARSYQNVTVMFADIANFTRITTTMPPKRLVSTLHELFSSFDRIADHYGVEKIKTIGDAYMAAAGCPETSKDSAQRVGHFALEIMRSLESFNKRHNTRFDIRIGIHTGSLIGGVISGKRISFDIWGETVNLTSRLQSSAEPGEIIISDTTAKIFKDDFVVTEFRMVDFKGLGPTPVARLMSAKNPSSFDTYGNSAHEKNHHVSEIAFLSQH